MKCTGGGGGPAAWSLVADSLETWTTDRCIEFIGQCADEGQPFFAWLTYDRPHLPVTLPDEWFRQMTRQWCP